MRRARRGRERGAVAVEFAFVLPIFVLLIFGVVQYGGAFFQVQQAAFAAREAARLVAVGSPTCKSLLDQVNDRIVISDAPTLTVTFVEQEGTSGAQAGDKFIVDVSFSNAIDLGILPVPSQIQQVAETRIENVTQNSELYDGCF